MVVDIDEAYIHCRKHIPRMAPVPHHRDWGADDIKRKGGDYFDAKGTRRHDQETADIAMSTTSGGTPAQSCTPQPHP
ncbi:hypothetical protein [Rhodococcus opacus]|uniref:hypothetical protein n=1 Tax=Rhodococcus opacus TaxID=37919 RepID=UPI003D7A5C19